MDEEGDKGVSVAISGMSDVEVWAVDTTWDKYVFTGLCGLNLQRGPSGFRIHCTLLWHSNLYVRTMGSVWGIDHARPNTRYRARAK